MSDHWDVIALRGLSAVGSHGVHEFERHGTQVFSADLRLYVDSRKAAITDDVAYTVDYSQMAEDAVAILSGTPVFLLETLAAKLAEMALSYDLVQKVDVTVHKPMAPVRHKFEDVSVSVTRTKPNGVEASEPEPTKERVEVPSSPSRSRRRPVAAAVAPAKLGGPQRSASSPKAITGALLIPRSFTDGSKIYRAVLSLGSNRGDSIATLAGAVAALSEIPGFEVDTVSPLVRTVPVLEPGALPQADYLNTVVIGRTVLAPPVLLESLNRVEAAFGRVRGRRWSARTLDIDIVDLDGMRIDSRDLTLPHPRAHERAFVLYPWSLIAPNDLIPGRGRVKELLESADDFSGILGVRENWYADGKVVPGVELKLNERPGRTSFSDISDLPSVNIRGERLHLAHIEGDPVFKQLLERELSRSVEDAHAPDISTSVGKGENIPDWRSVAGPTAPRVVDEPGAQNSADPVEALPSAHAARRVTVRPTPTGHIPVIRRSK